MPIIIRTGGGSGGGGAAFSATLTVNTDAGATITATSSSAGKTYTGTVGTNGKCVLTITAPGTYTVKATQGSTSVSGSVVVADNEAGYTLTLTFWDGVLYNAGNEYSSITGGWAVHKQGSLSKDNNVLTMTSTTWGNIRHSTLIDFSKYSTLHVTFGNVNKRAGFGLVTSANASTSWFTNNTVTGTFAASYAPAETVKYTTATLDISSVNEKAYVVIGGGSSGDGSFVVTKVWVS